MDEILEIILPKSNQCQPILRLAANHTKVQNTDKKDKVPLLSFRKRKSC